MKDPYLYPNTNVLRNKIDIHDAGQLAEVENDIVYLKLIDVDDFSATKTFDVPYLRDLHHFLFEDIYDWAGEFRKMNIRKQERVLDGMSVEYADCSSLDKKLDKEFQDLNAVEWKGLSLLERATLFSKKFAAIWKIHPFREGNTRTITTFMLQYASNSGLELDGALLAKYSSYVREALVMASLGEYAEPDHLEKIILDAMGGMTYDEKSTDNSYEYINEYDVKDYHYKPFNEE